MHRVGSAPVVRNRAVPELAWRPVGDGRSELYRQRIEASKHVVSGAVHDVYAFTFQQSLRVTYFREVLRLLEQLREERVVS